MGRIEELEMELDEAMGRLNDSSERASMEDEQRIREEIDRIMLELHTLTDTWEPELTDVDVNELA